MSRRAERSRANLRGSARHSKLMSDGRGDPRDSRRESSRLTDNAFDPEFFEIDTQGRLTLKGGGATAAMPSFGRGLRVAQDGSIELRLGSSLVYLSGGTLEVRQVEEATLTDNTAGTAGDTLAAIPDPADGPVTADNLRDDLVANALPAIRDALASLAAKLNAILAALDATSFQRT